ncbi:MAG: hypothetical protein ACLUFD_00010 [Faecalibacterium sp.]
MQRYSGSTRKKYKPGDKIATRSAAQGCDASTISTKSFESEALCHLVIAHTDSPRLDAVPPAV